MIESKAQAVPLVILAAGRGRRLGSLTEALPKCLIEVGGRSLLARQLAAASCVSGLGPVVVVTGFARERVASCCGDGVVECYNSRWDVANNIVSLAVAAEAGWLDGGFVLFNSDVLFHPGILDRLLAFPGSCALVVDERRALTDEAMKVAADSDGRIHAIAKTLDTAASSGEYIGLAKFGRGGAAVVRRALDELIEAGRTGDWYEAAFQVAFERLPVHACLIGGLPWIEIDTPADLEAAQSVAAQLEA
ncbi:MAG: NTP transferase domain-containing protein [Kiritimatiellia bacterium]|jgi:choline kinase